MVISPWLSPSTVEQDASKLGIDPFGCRGILANALVLFERDYCGPGE